MRKVTLAIVATKNEDGSTRFNVEVTPPSEAIKAELISVVPGNVRFNADDDVLTARFGVEIDKDSGIVVRDDNHLMVDASVSELMSDYARELMVVWDKLEAAIPEFLEPVFNTMIPAVAKDHTLLANLDEITAVLATEPEVCAGCGLPHHPLGSELMEGLAGVSGLFGRVGSSPIDDIQGHVKSRVEHLFGRAHSPHPHLDSPLHFPMSVSWPLLDTEFVRKRCEEWVKENFLVRFSAWMRNQDSEVCQGIGSIEENVHRLSIDVALTWILNDLDSFDADTDRLKERMLRQLAEAVEKRAKARTSIATPRAFYLKYGAPLEGLSKKLGDLIAKGDNLKALMAAATEAELDLGDKFALGFAEMEIPTIEIHVLEDLPAALEAKKAEMDAPVDEIEPESTSEPEDDGETPEPDDSGDEDAPADPDGAEAPEAEVESEPIPEPEPTNEDGDGKDEDDAPKPNSGDEA